MGPAIGHSLQAAAPFSRVADIRAVVTIIIAATAHRDGVGVAVISGVRHGRKLICVRDML